MKQFLDTFPVATVVHLLAVLVVSVLFVVNNGQLPDDTVQYIAVVEGGNGLLAIGRGLTTRT